MTDTDTTSLVVRRGTGQHPAGRRRSVDRAEPPLSKPAVLRPWVVGPTTLDQPVEVGPAEPDSIDGPAGDDEAIVLHLNDAATIYDALAEEIAGTASGWSAEALAQLERGLLERYGHLIGGRHPVRRLVRLASRPPG